MGYTENNPMENKLISSTIDGTICFLLCVDVWNGDSLILPKVCSIRAESCSRSEISAALYKCAFPMGPPKASSSVPEVKNTSSAIKFAVQGGIVRVLICALIANTIV